MLQSRTLLSRRRETRLKQSASASKERRRQDLIRKGRVEKQQTKGKALKQDTLET